jgi:hypothetical protein
MSPTTIGILIGLLYAFIGIRILIVLDSIHDSPTIRWTRNREAYQWLLMLAWPVALLMDFVLHIADRALTRVLRKGVRS